MDSAPRTSEPGSFGIGLVRRTRPRSRATRSLGGARTVGRIARSSIGFGRAVGRAGTVRPAVGADSLISLQPRPPVMWLRPDDEAVDATTTAQPSWTDRLVSGTPAPSVRRAASTPRPATPAAAPGPQVQSFGDPKVDAMRRLLASRAAAEPAAGASGSPSSSAAARTVGRAMQLGASMAASARPSVDGSSSVPGRSSDRGDTAGGDRTAPGRLGDRSRPERVEPDTRATGPSREPSERSTTARPARRAGVDDMQTLRRQLVEREERLRSGRRAAGTTTPGPQQGRPPGGTGGPESTPSGSPGRGNGSAAPPPVSAPRTDTNSDVRRRDASPDGGSAAAGDGGAVLTAPAPPAVPPAPAGESPESPGSPGSPGSTGSIVTERRLDAPDADVIGDVDTIGAERVDGARVAASPPLTSDRLARQRAIRRAVDATTIADTDGLPLRPPAVTALADGGAPVAEPPTSAAAPTGAAARSDQPAARRTVDRAAPRRAVPRLGHPSPLRRALSPETAPTAPGALDGLPLSNRPATLPPIVPATDRVEPSAPASLPVRPPAVEPVDSGPAVDDLATPADSDVVRRAASTDVTPPPAAVPIESWPATDDTPLRRRVSLPRAMSHEHRPNRRPVAGDLAAEVGSAMSRAVAPDRGAATSVVRRTVVDRAQPSPARPAPPSPDGPGRVVAPQFAAPVEPALAGAPSPTHPVTAHPAAEPGPGAPVDASRPVAIPTDDLPVDVSASAPVAPAAPPLARKFESELARRTPATPAALPVRFRPLAEAIAPRRRVMLSTDTTSRRALRSVGRKAATVDDTIHLDPVAVTSDRLAEVMAHELTHVASPSPVPRFFDDPHDSPEERRAEAVAAVIARAPTAPSASLLGRDRAADAGRAPAGGTSPVIRRAMQRPTQPSAATSSSGTVSAAALAAQLTGSTPPAPTTIHRSVDTPTAPPVRRVVDDGPDLNASGEVTSAAEAAQLSDAEFERLFSRNLDRIMRLIQQRLESESGRSGGRLWGRRL